VFGPKKIRWKKKNKKVNFFPLFGVKKKRRKKNTKENLMKNYGK